MHTPGGVSNTYFLTLLTGAPAVFLTHARRRTECAVRRPLEQRAGGHLHQSSAPRRYSHDLSDRTGRGESAGERRRSRTARPVVHDRDHSDRQDRRRGCSRAVFRPGSGLCGMVRAECERFRLDPARAQCATHDYRRATSPIRKTCGSSKNSDHNKKSAAQTANEKRGIRKRSV